LNILNQIKSRENKEISNDSIIKKDLLTHNKQLSLKGINKEKNYYLQKDNECLSKKIVNVKSTIIEVNK